MVEKERPGDKSFTCVICGKESRTGHFKWQLCHTCYLNKMRQEDTQEDSLRVINE